MARSLFSLAGILLTGVALAAPAPESFISGWGNPVDSDRDCKIRRDNGTLTIEMPGTCHEYDPAHNRMNAPRLIREFEGDFVIQFQVRIACRPSRESTLADQPPFVAAGLLLISPDNLTFKWNIGGPGIRAGGSVVDMQQFFQDADGNYHEYAESHKPWKNRPLKSEPEHVYLRLERWGDLLSVHSSPDGKTWEKVSGGSRAGLPPKLKVGLAAYTTSKDPSKVIFDQLQIIRGKKWERWEFESGWGNPIDPDKDCKIKRDKDALTIEMPGTNHDYDAYRKRFNAPRLLSDLKGDFDVQVRVHIDSRTSAQSTVKGQPSFVSAGFLLIHAETANGGDEHGRAATLCDRMEYALIRQGIRAEGYAPVLAEPRRNNPVPIVTEPDIYAVKKHWPSLRGMSAISADFCKQQATDGFLWDRGWQYWPLPEKADCAYLRVEQRGAWLYFSISPDGRKWTSLACEHGLPAKGKLGLAAYTTSSEPSKVIFDQLKLARIEKKD
jgi:regulation of enolase protein 1 (concanavalin A-like superfamily)